MENNNISQDQTTLSSTPNDHTPPAQSTRSKSKHLLPVIIILVLLLLASLAASTYFIIKNSQQASEISDLKNQLSDQGTTIIVDSDTDSSRKPTLSKEDVLTQVPSLLTFTSDHKCLNHPSYFEDYTIHYRPTEEGMGGPDLGKYEYRISFDYTTSTPYLTIDWDYIKAQPYKLYGLTNITKSGTETITDFKLSGQPIELLYTSLSPQATGYEYLLFLMTDGTIEYITLDAAFSSNNFASQGKLPEIKDVIKLYNVHSNSKQDDGAIFDVLAQRANGDYYSIRDALESVNAYH